MAELGTAGMVESSVFCILPCETTTLENLNDSNKNVRQNESILNAPRWQRITGECSVTKGRISTLVCSNHLLMSKKKKMLTSP